MHKKKTKYGTFDLLLGAVLAICGVLGIYFGIFVICECFHICIFDPNDFEYGEWLSISYSTIFLSTSLLGMLSDKSETVYWVNVNEYSLVNPRWFNFFTLSTIGYVTLLIETYAVLARKPLLVMVCFAVGIFTIISIFYKMMGSKYSRERLKQKLEERFHKEMPEKGEKNDYIEGIYTKLYKTTEIACQYGKLEIIDENIDFYFCNVYENVQEELMKEKLEAFLLLLNQYGFLRRAIDYLWSEGKEIINKQENQYLSAIICAENQDTRKIWDTYKEKYFWEAIDWKIDGALKAASDDKHKEYKKIMTDIARILCVNCASEQDIKTFLIHRIGEKKSVFEGKTIEHDPKYDKDGKTIPDIEQLGTLCFLFEAATNWREGFSVFLSALEAVLLYPVVINKQDSESQPVECFIINGELKNTLFDTLFEYINKSRRKGKENSKIYDILNELVLQRSCNKKMTEQLMRVIDLYNREDMTALRSSFVTSLSDFLFSWICDYDDGIQYWCDSESNEKITDLELQKAAIIEIIDAISFFWADAVEKERFMKLKEGIL